MKDISRYVYAWEMAVMLVVFSITASSAEQEATPVIKYDHPHHETRHLICPLSYSIQIFEDGRVIYNGRTNVAVLGERRSQISKDAVARLKNSFQAARFFEMKTVETDPNTGMTKHDCKQDPEWLTKYGLADLCRGKDSIERFERFRVERSMDSTLFFRDGYKSRSLRIWDVSMEVDVLNALAREINEVAGIQKWIEPTCPVAR